MPRSSEPATSRTRRRGGRVRQRGKILTCSPAPAGGRRVCARSDWPRSGSSWMCGRAGRRRRPGTRGCRPISRRSTRGTSRLCGGCSAPRRASHTRRRGRAWARSTSRWWLRAAHQLAAGSCTRAGRLAECRDPRSLLTVEPLRFALALRPRWIALEQSQPCLSLPADAVRRAALHPRVSHRGRRSPRRVLRGTADPPPWRVSARLARRAGEPARADASLLRRVPTRHPAR